MNHSLISASGNTHAKIAGLALAVSMVFVAIVSATSATSVTRSDSSSARVHGPVVKATTMTSMAGSGQSAVR